MITLRPSFVEASGENEIDLLRKKGFDGMGDRNVQFSQVPVDRLQPGH